MNKFYNESEEMYLETILILREEKKKIHAIDIANQMNFSRASVSRAVQNLKVKGYIDILNDDTIILLDKGLEYANKIYDRHKVLRDFFIKLGVDPKISDDDACKIEHAISDETMEKIKEFINKN